MTTHRRSIRTAAAILMLLGASRAGAAVIHLTPGQNIGAAAAAAAPGDTLLLGCGAYAQDGIEVPDGVVIRGAGPEASCVSIASFGLSPIFSMTDTGPGTRLENLTLLLPDGIFPDGLRGGGLYLQNAFPVVTDCRFDGLAAGYGGAVYCAGGSAPLFSGCAFEGNRADAAGGAVACSGGSSPTFVSCLFWNNASLGSGGAVNAAMDAHARFYSCTLVGNDAVVGSALSAWDGSAFDVVKTIVSGGLGSRGWNGDAASAPAIACSDFFGNQGGDWVGVLAAMEGSAGNIAADPLFCGDFGGLSPFTLDEASPCAEYAALGCGRMGAFAVACAVSGVPAPSPTPGSTRLRGNHPNPFNPVTTIAYDTRRAGKVNLVVFDVAGRRVRTLVQGHQEAGTHKAVWDGRGDDGRPAAAGIYFYLLRTDDASDAGRMALVK